MVTTLQPVEKRELAFGAAPSSWFHESQLPTADCVPEEGVGAYTSLRRYGATALRQERIPRDYIRMDAAERDERIWALRRQLGERLVILGHHYQRDEVIQFADFRGDSFKLSQQAASRAEADTILFCGVHFMAESADILSGPHQQVILPNLEAGCSMADMAKPADVEACWAALADLGIDRHRPDHLHELGGQPQGLLRAQWRHRLHLLERRSGLRLGVRARRQDPLLPGRAPRPQHRRQTRHPGRPDGRLGSVPAARRQHAGGAARGDGDPLEGLLLGPRPIFGRADRRRPHRLPRRQRDRPPGVPVGGRARPPTATARRSSSSTRSRRRPRARPGPWAPRSTSSTGSKHELPDKRIFCLDPIVCPCSTMYRVHPAYLLWSLEHLVAGRVVNRITVDPETKRDALVALDRMLAVP